MKIRAAVAFEPGKPLEIEEVELEGPREGECLVRLAAAGVCHTDAYTLSGADPEGVFPVVLGHEAESDKDEASITVEFPPSAPKCTPGVASPLRSLRLGKRRGG